MVDDDPPPRRRRRQAAPPAPVVEDRDEERPSVDDAPSEAQEEAQQEVAAPAPAAMPAPYHHQTESQTKAVVLGPLRATTDEDVVRCQNGSSRAQDDGVRDVYLRFEYFAGASPEEIDFGDPTDEARARDLACEVVVAARRLLPFGPFNNRGGLPVPIAGRCVHPRTEDARADFIFQDGLGVIDEPERPGDPDRFYVVGADATENMPGDLVKALALLAASTRRIGGGVCEKFASVVLGILSSIAPPGTVACKVAWSGDHHYVVLRIGTSRWWVADPWPHNAFVLPWTDNYFTQDRTVAYTQMEVVAPVGDWYGVVLSDEAIDDSLAIAQRTLPVSKDDGAFDHNWGQRHNLVGLPGGLPGNHDFTQYDDGATVILAADAGTWG